MKLYTKVGDDGTTRLFGNQKVSKDDARVEAYGDVDELNSALGVARAGCTFDEIGGMLDMLQNRLFDVGADLATPHSETGDPPYIYRIAADDALDLERLIDATCEPLPAMRQFILPGGTELAARLHHARCICRRAERRCVTLSHHATGIGAIIIYLNRLSDLLFALARRANQLAGIDDVPWRKKSPDA